MNEENLEKKNEKLHAQVSDSNTIILKFTNGQKSLKSLINIKSIR